MQAICETHQPRMGSHSSRLRIAPQLEQPTRATGSKHPALPRRTVQARRPYLALLQVGFAMRALLPAAPVRSCRTLSPLPVRPNSRRSARHRRYTLCGTFPRLHPKTSPGGRYPPPLFHGARTFLAITPVSRGDPAAARPPGRAAYSMGAGFRKASCGQHPLVD